MSQLLDDLEEGEIADDIDPEPIIEKKSKSLPRRYVINDKKLKSKHKKKNCKHTPEHYKRKSSKSNFHGHSKSSIKHHKKCDKHNSVRHSSTHFCRDEIIDIDSIYRESQYNHKKVPAMKSAFKNFRSPPRKTLKIDNSKLVPPSPKSVSSNYSKSSEYKKSPNGVNKLNNFNDFGNSAYEIQLGKNPSKADEHLSKFKYENLPSVEVIDITDDDEDEEELRRLALATCKQPQRSSSPETFSEDSSSKINCSESELPAAADSDNYEIVDMDVDNESENLDKVNNLFVIDTTPTYFCELNGAPPVSIFDSQSNLNQLNNVIVNGFLPNIEDVCQTFNSDVFSQNINNDLYTNFEIDNSRLPSSQLDDEFEEELLRAELIANMKSMRQNNDNLPKEDDLTRDLVLVDNKLANISPKDTRVVRLKSDSSDNDRIVNFDISDNDRIVNFDSADNDRIVNFDSSGNDRIVNFDSSNNNRIVNFDSSVNDSKFKDERTVSIIKETPFVTKFRTVSSCMNPVLPNSNVRKGADIKVKLNNVHSVTPSTPNIISLPQERIVISLNNETSSDDSDQEDSFQVKQLEQNPAVASLEALISSARQESDIKKNTQNLNNASDALSCLSKAQQEEYNSLIKILAEKDPSVQNSQEAIKITEDANLILLKKKIKIAKDNYEKEKAIMNTTMKELGKKKHSYMLSKIKTQQLKEQLAAAEKVRKTNLQVWTKCAGELQTLKRSVYKRQALINSLQTKISAFFPEKVLNGIAPVSIAATEQEYPLR